MSQIQLTENQQEPQTNDVLGKNKKRSSRKKSATDNEGSGGGGLAIKCVNTELTGTTMEQSQLAYKPPHPVVSRKAAGSNWLAVTKPSEEAKQKPSGQENLNGKEGENHAKAVTLTKSARRRQKLRAAENKYIAMDCEMVGVGPNGQDDMLARVSIVSKRGEVLLDKFVKPREAVTDYRTSVSGIRPNNIINGEDFESVQKEVIEMIQGKILVGHAIRNDLSVLQIKHNANYIRDTSRYKPLCHLVARGRTPSLKRLTLAVLGKEIQTGEHNSVEDARAAMSIYNILASEWEAHERKRQQKHRK